MDEFDGFDARLHWAKENGEDSSMLLIEKAKYDIDIQVMQFLSQGPKTRKEIMQHFNLNERQLNMHLLRLRKRDVRILRHKGKYADYTVFELAEKPKDFRFYY